MRLSFFSHFDKRHLSHTSTNATSLFDSKRRYFAIAQYASLLRYFAIAQYASLLRYWLCQYAPLGWAIAGRRYAQLARLCARRWWRLARIRRALPSVYCPVHNLAEKTTKPAQRAGFPNKKTTKPAQRAGFPNKKTTKPAQRAGFQNKKTTKPAQRAGFQNKKKRRNPHNARGSQIKKNDETRPTGGVFQRSTT